MAASNIVNHQHKRAHYSLALLMCVAVFSYIDRTIIAVLQEGMRIELGLSDTQLGMLTGLGFAIFYTLFAIPIARIADTWVRKYVIAVALGFWSLMTAGSGLAASFLALLIFRIGVAIGEAGSVPTTHSLISDYYPKEKRATALSIWGLTLSIGPMTGFLLGGWLNDLVGWRQTFIIFGLAGVALVPVILLTLPEPVRGATDRNDDETADSQSAEKAPDLSAVARSLWQLRSFRYLCIGTALHAFSAIAMVNWNAPFYQRVHELSATEVGIYLGLIIGVGGALGTLAGGMLADHFGRRDSRFYMWVPAVSTLLVIPFGLIQYLVPNLTLSLAAAFAIGVLTSAYLGPVNGTSQSLVKPGMRAVTSATLVFVTNIIGMGLGPLFTGILSDWFSLGFNMGPDSLRYAILCTLLANVFAGIAYAYASRFVDRDMKANA